LKAVKFSHKQLVLVTCLLILREACFKEKREQKILTRMSHLDLKISWNFIIQQIK